MKKYLFVFCLMLFILTTSFAFAQSQKTISLKDGSQIKGTILSVEDNIYVIQTAFGILEINDNDILNISAQNDLANNPSNVISKEQLSGYQEQILQNPQVMSGIQDIISDPEVVEALSDPEFAQAVMSQDLQKIQTSDNFKKLMQNPKMQQLINSTGQAIQP